VPQKPTRLFVQRSVLFCPFPSSDQGCQFTCEAFTSILTAWNVSISMDGKERFKDNIFIERL
jgi:hypothetical protein